MNFGTAMPYITEAESLFSIDKEILKAKRVASSYQMQVPTLEEADVYKGQPTSYETIDG